jgi:CheY-like chemotaxis protein
VAGLLIVEDDARLCCALSRAITSMELGRAQVRCATSAVEADALLSGHDDWAGFLVDVHLDVDKRAEGLALASRARARHAAAPVFVLTADSSAGVTNAVAALPGATLLRKPLPPRATLAAILAPIAGCARAVDRRARVEAWAHRHGLTRGERLAVLSIALGQSRAAYCAEHAISDSTFRTHVHNTLDKLTLRGVRELRAALGRVADGE